MVLWCYGVMMLWCYGVMVLWCYNVIMLSFVILLAYDMV